MKVFVTGGSGFVGQHVVKHLSRQPNTEVHFTYHNNVHTPPDGVTAHRVDISKKEELAILKTLRPDVIVHCAAIGNQTTCEKNPELAKLMNAETVRMIAESCIEYRTGADRGIPPLIIFTSTDMVYDGVSGPYTDASAASPVNEYGRSKTLAEEYLTKLWPASISLRCALIYGESGEPTKTVASDGTLGDVGSGRTPTSFMQWMGPAIAKSSGEPFNLFEDEYRCAVYVDDIAACIAGFARKHASDSPYSKSRIYNMGGPRSITRYEIGSILLDHLVSLGLARERSQDGESRPRILGVPQSSVTFPFGRPLDTSMDSTGVYKDAEVTPTSLEDAVKVCITSLEQTSS